MFEIKDSDAGLALVMDRDPAPRNPRLVEDPLFALVTWQPGLGDLHGWPDRTAFRAAIGARDHLIFPLVRVETERGPVLLRQQEMKDGPAIGYAFASFEHIRLRYGLDAITPEIRDEVMMPTPRLNASASSRPSTTTSRARSTATPSSTAVARSSRPAATSTARTTPGTWPRRPSSGTCSASRWTGEQGQEGGALCSRTWRPHSTATGTSAGTRRRPQASRSIGSTLRPAPFDCSATSSEWSEAPIRAHS